MVRPKGKSRKQWYLDRGLEYPTPYKKNKKNNFTKKIEIPKEVLDEWFKPNDIFDKWVGIFFDTPHWRKVMTWCISNLVDDMRDNEKEIKKITKELRDFKSEFSELDVDYTDIASYHNERLKSNKKLWLWTLWIAIVSLLAGITSLILQLWII